MTKFELHDGATKGLQYQKSTVTWLKSQKTNTETHAYVQLWVNFKGMCTKNILNKVNMSCSSLYPIIKVAKNYMGRVRIDTVGIVTSRLLQQIHLP